MANCPKCAERIGWLDLLSDAEECGSCGLPFERGSSGQILTYAQEHAEQVLNRPRTIGHWFLLGFGLVTTAALSAVPTGGVLVATGVFFVQALTYGRSVSHYREHFDMLHSVTSDFFSGLFLAALVGVQTLLGAVLPVLSGLTNAALYLFGWFCFQKYFRAHFERLADGKAPHPAELTLISAMILTVVLPPAVLTAVVAYLYFL